MNPTRVTPEDLARVTLFAPLADDARARLAESMHIRHYQRGMMLFFEGEPAETLYIVLRGLVRVYQTLADGREYTLEYLGRSELLAIVSCFDGLPYPASAQALGALSVATLGHRAFEEFLHGEAELPFECLRILSGRLRRAHARSTELAVRTVHERLASTLLRLVNEQIAIEKGEAGAEEGEAASWLVPIRAAELGRLIGAARETVVRALHDFERQGAVKSEGGQPVVRDREKLRSWCPEAL